MKSSSPPPSSSSSSTSVTAAPQTQVLSSSSSPPPLPRLNLQSPELQAEFLQEFQNKFRSHGDIGESGVASSAVCPSASSSSPFSPSSSPSSPPPSPFTPTPSSSPCGSSSSSSSPSYNNRQARLSLSSPELLSELKDSRTRTLRHVPARNGLTTVFTGRGGRGRVSDPTPFTPTANQKTPH